jgi:hypothetical protein
LRGDSENQSERCYNARSQQGLNSSSPQDAPPM